LFGRRHAAQQVAHVIDEAQVEHAVGLVQHDDFRCLQIKNTLFEVVDEPPRRANQHVHPGFQGFPLGVITGTAIHHGHTQTAGAAKLLGITVNLHRQLPGRRQNQGARLIQSAPRGRRMGEQTVHQRQQEGRRLTSSGLCLSGHIMACQRKRQSCGLNRCAMGKTRRDRARQQRGGQIQIGKREWSIQGSIWRSHPGHRQS
jgi:hypothetical protein